MMAVPGPSIDRSGPPSAGPIRPFHLPELRSDSLENGLRFSSMLRGQVPIVSARLVLDAGETGTPAGHAGVAVLTGDSLQGGTESRDGAELAETLERLGSGLSVSSGWDATVLAFTCVAERVEEVLSLASEVVRIPAFPSKEVERVRRQRLSAIEQRRMDPASLADDELDRRLFDPGHPYHRPLAGDEESVGSLGRWDLVAFASERYTPATSALVVVGDLSADQVGSLARDSFSKWGSREGAEILVPVPSGPPLRSVTIVHRPGAVQSELRIGLPAPARGHPDEIPLRVSNTVLGGAFTSRLNLSLREKHGFTYGARSAFAFRRDGGLFTIGTAVQTEVTGQALSEAISVLSNFAEGGPSRDELTGARDYLAGVFPLRMETTAQLAARISELIIFGLPDDYHHTYRDRIRAVEVDSARAAVSEHLHPERSKIVVVGDADRIVSEVEKLGLGPVEVSEP